MNTDSSRDVSLCESCRYSGSAWGSGIGGGLTSFHYCRHPKRKHIEEEKEYYSCKYYSNED